jgi:hypothetical protein
MGFLMCPTYKGESIVRKYLFKGVLLFICVFGFLSCMHPSNLQTIEKLIPSDAPFYLHIGNVDQFLSNIDAFIKPLDIKTITGDMPVKTMLKNLFVSIGGDFKFESFDLKKPWGVAVRPPNGTNPLFIEILVPLSDPKKDFDAFKKMAAALEVSEVKLAGNYAVLFPQAEAQIEFPPKQSIDLAELESFPDATATLWIDVKGALKSFGFDPATLGKTILSALSGNGSSGQEKTKPAITKLVSAFTGVLDEIETVTWNLQLDKNGLTTRSNLKVTKDKSIDRISRTLANYKGITAYTKYIPSQYLYSASAHIDPDFFGKVITAVYKPIMDAAEMTDSEKTEIDKLVKTLLAVKTSETSVAVDIDADFNKIAQLGSDDSTGYEDETAGTKDRISDFIKKIGDSFAMNVVSVSEAKDADAYRKSLEDVAKSPALDKLFNSMLGKLGVEGVSVKYLFSYTRDKKVGSILCDELGFGIELTEKGKPVSAKSKLLAKDMKEALDAAKTLFDKYKVLLHFKNNKCYMVMGKNSESVIENLSKNDAYPEPNLLSALNSHPREKEMFDAAQFGTHFSLMRLLGMMKSMPELRGALNLSPTGKEIGIVGASRYTNARWQSVSIWNIDEIKTIVDAAKKNLNLGDLFKP